MKVLVINAGSSSIKYQLIDMQNEELLAKGLVERIGEPSASQLSSTSHRLCLSQNSFTDFRSKGLPRVCAIITAFVLSLNAPSSLLISMLYWGIVTSTKTGTAP